MMRCNSSSVKGAFLAALLEPTDALMSALTGDSGIHLRFGDTGRTRATFETLALWAPPEFPVGPEQADLGRRQLSIVM
jgi:hypothetical protein